MEDSRQSKGPTRTGNVPPARPLGIAHIRVTATTRTATVSLRCAIGSDDSHPMAQTTRWTGALPVKTETRSDAAMTAIFRRVRTVAEPR